MMVEVQQRTHQSVLVHRRDQIIRVGAAIEETPRRCLSHYGGYGARGE